MQPRHGSFKAFFLAKLMTTNVKRRKQNKMHLELVESSVTLRGKQGRWINAAEVWFTQNVIQTRAKKTKQYKKEENKTTNKQNFFR